MTDILLAIESSCDDASAALVDCDRQCLLDSRVHSQTMHAPFGGVVPELASRDHLKQVPRLICEVLQSQALNWQDIGKVAVTNRPGLIGSLLMGLMAAKTIAMACRVPLVAVNHLHAHIFSGFWQRKVAFPFLGVVVSGGHSDLFLVQDYVTITRKGQTMDDAAGEIIDKIAKELGLGYPGGPAVERQAALHRGDPFPLPVPMRHKPGYNLSFSGLKTAAYLLIKRLRREGGLQAGQVHTLCFSLLDAIGKSIVAKIKRACRDLGLVRVVCGGGVMRNAQLRAFLAQELEQAGIELHLPPKKWCTDNAAMVAYLGMVRAQKGLFADAALNAYPAYE